MLCFKLGKVAHAEKVAREAIAVAPKDAPLGLPVARCILGIALYFQGELGAAAESLEEAVRLSVGGGNQLARIYAKTEFVQAIKLSMDVVGRNGGGCRPPRGPLSEAAQQQVHRIQIKPGASGKSGGQPMSGQSGGGAQATSGTTGSTPGKSG